MSMPRRDKDYLNDICEAMRRIVAYAEGLSYEQFLQDPKTQDAVIRNLQVIGEATKRVSPSLRTVHHDLPGREMAGMRDKIVHDYFGINYDIVWMVARQELSSLLPRLEAILEAEE